MIPSDPELIESCLRGDQAGWTQLISRYQRLIHSVARALCPQPEDSADVFQQVCLTLYQNLDGLRSEKTLPAWLITVTRRTAYASLRARKQQIPVEEHHATVDARIEQIEREFALEQALLLIPERCQKLIRLLYLDSTEPSYAQIAEEMGMPVPSIGPTRARCLEKLKQLLMR